MKKVFPLLILFCANILFAQFPCSTGFNGNGTDEFITVPNTDAINLQNTRNRTIEFWFKAPNITTRQVIYEEGAGVNAFVFFIEADRIYLGAYRDNASVAADRRLFRSGSGDIEVNKWYHVALTLEDTAIPDLTLKWFLNGIEQDSQDGLQVNTHSGTVTYARNGDGLRYPNSLVSNWTASSVGGSTSETYNDTFTGSNSTTYAFSGNINLFRIWNVARTQSEIDTNKSILLTSGTDLVAYSDLDRIYYQPDGATAISLTAFVSVTTQFTTIPNTDAINDQNTSNRTIELRFRATDLTTRQVLYEEGGNTNAFKIFLEGGRVYFSIYRSNAGSAANRRYFRSGVGELSIGQWYHVAVTLDSGITAKWFLDGVEQDSQAGLVVNTHTGDINIGRSGGDMRYPSSLLDADWDVSSVGGSTGQTYDGGVVTDGNSNNFSGDIELFRIWNVPRTPSEIDTNKNTFLDSGTELVAYQSGAQINYQPNGGSSPSASEDAQGVITWDGSDGNSWTTTTNWVGDSAPDITRSQKIIITNDGTNPVIAANTNVGFLNISSGVNLVVQAGSTLNVYYELVNNGTITVENEASLIYHNCNNPVSGTGTFDVVRNTRTYSDNDFYSYWSSPVVSNTVSSVFPDAEEVYEYAANLTDANWVFFNPSNTMNPTTGYAIQNEGLGGQVRTFSGDVNNGGYDVTLFFNENEDEGDTGNEWSPGGDNLVGNPYSSAIDWDLVIGDTDNSDIEGTIYLWNQQSAETGDNNVSDYLQYNPTGGTNTATGKIGTAQAFFLRVDDMIGAGNTTTLKIKATHQVTGDNTSATFYKSSKKKSNVLDKQKGRSWFKLKRGNTYNSILIGFVKGATEDYDRIYDGPFDINQKSLGFYSLVEETKKATIQGLPILTENEKAIPLGFVVDQTGEYSIQLQEEYVDDSYYIYLEDKELGVFVDLNQQEVYSFTIDTVGENNTRFKIIYTKEKKETLSTETTHFKDNNLSVFVNSEKELVVKYAELEEIEKITLYTILGRKVKVFQSNTSKKISDLKTGVYLVKTNLREGKIITKKIVIAN